MSVIVPAYNAAQYIGQTLESVCAQTYKRIEIIVVDDGSQDETPAIVKELAARDPRITLLVQSNAGVGAARNLGIRHARGEYIAPVDADDTWHPRKLEDQVTCMEAAGERTGLVYCWANLIDEDGAFLGHCSRTETEGSVLPKLIQGNFLHCASIPLFRASALAAVGLYLTRTEQQGGEGCEDWDIALRIAEDYEFRAVRAHLVGYRRTNGMTLRTNEMINSFRSVQRRARQRSRHLSPHMFQEPEASFYYWLAFRCYVAGKFMQSFALMLKVASLDPKGVLRRPVYSLLIKAAVRSIVPSFSGAPRRARNVSSTPIAAMFPPYNI